MATVEFGKALYFPHIELWSRVNWLKMAALYHDQICRIVPASYHTYDPDDVKKLIDVGFIERRSPSQAAASLVEEFYVFASENLLDDAKRKRLATELNASQVWGHIHMEKIDSALAKALSQQDLLRENDSEWYEVEPVTGLLYMTFLAKKLARSWPLISDDPPSQRLAYSTPSVTANSGPVGDIGYRIASAAIRTWVPVDLNNVPMSAIIDIRQNFADERVHFYNAVGLLGKDLSKVTDESDLRDAIEQRQTSIGRSLEALRVKLENSRLAMRAGIFSVSAPAIGTAASVTDPVALAGLGAASAVSAGWLVWKYHRDVRLGRLENSWSYLMRLSDELDEFNPDQHFMRLGLDRDHLAARPQASVVDRFKRSWRKIGRTF